MALSDQQPKSWLENKWNNLIFDTRCPFYSHGLTLIPAWTGNHMTIKVTDDITYQFPNCPVEVSEWICHFILHFLIYDITNPCWD